MNQKQKKTKKAQLIEIYGPCCWWCERNLPKEELTMDHITPKSKGDSDNLENLKLACRPCNQKRGDSLFPPKQYVYGK